jgi:hypothetical protein
MRVLVVLLVLTVGFTLRFSGPSEASVLGPFCFTIPPFTDVLKLSFITDDGGSTGAVAGRDVSINTAVTGGAVLESDGITVNMVATVGAPTLGISAYLLQVRFSRLTSAGSGRCQTVNPTSGGCGFGTNISFLPVGCPVGAQAEVQAIGHLAGGGD